MNDVVGGRWSDNRQGRRVTRSFNQAYQYRICGYHKTAAYA